MTCRRCQRRFQNPAKGACPHCGEPVSPATSGVMKTSTIFISAGLTDAVYRSVAEIPSPLRKQLLKSTSGMNSATILIADRRGKEELAKAIRRLPGNAQQRLLDAVFGQKSEAALVRFLKPHWHTMIGAGLAALLAAAIWVIASHRW